MVSDVSQTYRYTNEEHMTTTKTQLPLVNLARTFGAAIIALLAALGAHAQPTWTQTFQSGQSADYYAYTDSNSPVEQSGTSTTRPPHTYGASYTVTPTFKRGVCPYDNRLATPAVYWYLNGNALGNSSGAGTSTPPTFPSAVAAEYTETTWGSPITSVKGIQADVDFTSGSGSGGSDFYETVYFTDRYCTDAGNEYGYYYDVITGVYQFYWGSLENCSYYNSQGQVETECYQNANGTGPEYTNSGAVNISDLQQPNSHQTNEWRYQAWVVPGQPATLTMAVVDPFDGAYAQCKLGTSNQLGNCTWSGLGSVSTVPGAVYNSTGWVVAGTVAVGSPSITNGFSVTGVYVGQ